MGVYLRAKFQESSIIVTSFRQGVISSPTPPQNKPLKHPPRLGLMESGIKSIQESLVSIYQYFGLINLSELSYNAAQITKLDKRNPSSTIC